MKRDFGGQGAFEHLVGLPPPAQTGAVYVFVTNSRQPWSRRRRVSRRGGAGARRLGRRGDTLSTTTSTYLSIENNLARYQKMVASEPSVKTATEYYAANIGKVNSISDLVGNYRLLSYALTAYGLGDQVQNKALVTKVLEGGYTSSKALANTLSNPNWAKFAKAFDFVGSGASSISTSERGLDHGNELRRAAARNPARAAGRRRPARALFPARRADDHLVLRRARRREPARGVPDHLWRDAQHQRQYRHQRGDRFEADADVGLDRSDQAQAAD